MSDSDSSDASTTDSESSGTSSSNERNFSKKKPAERRLRHINHYCDNFGMCQNCKEIYCEMRHTWNDDNGEGYFSYEWYSDERFQKYENDEEVMLGHREIKRQYVEALLECKDCPRNKNTPCSLMDQAYSRISQTIAKRTLEEMEKNDPYNFKVSSIDEEIYDSRVAKLPVLDFMKKDLEAKTCRWECSHMRQLCSRLVHFS